MENEGSQGCNSVQVLRPENWEDDGVSPRVGPKAWDPGMLMSEGRRSWISQLKPREKSLLSSTSGSIQALSTLGDAPCIWEGDLLYSVHWSKCKCLPETPPSHTQYNVFTATWASLCPATQTHSIDPHKAEQWMSWLTSMFSKRPRLLVSPVYSLRLILKSFHQSSLSC